MPDSLNPRTPVQIGLVVSVLGLIGCVVWWASSISSEIRFVRETVLKVATEQCSAQKVIEGRLTELETWKKVHDAKEGK